MKNLICLLLLVSTSVSQAAHDSSTEWSWHVVSAGIDESRLALYESEQLHGIYNIDCDLTDASAGTGDGYYASINLVKLERRPAGVLIITCNVGAHSQRLSIIDPQHKPREEAFLVTGSYTASWELQNGELWIAFDEPCDTGPTVACPDGFTNTLVQYPAAANDSSK